jgi:hypothetical protein
MVGASQSGGVLMSLPEHFFSRLPRRILVLGGEGCDLLQNICNKIYACKERSQEKSSHLGLEIARKEAFGALDRLYGR